MKMTYLNREDFYSQLKIPQIGARKLVLIEKVGISYVKNTEKGSWEF